MYIIYINNIVSNPDLKKHPKPNLSHFGLLGLFVIFFQNNYFHPLRSTREFTFSGGDAARYPFEKIKIEEPLKIFGESSYFSCSADGGWYKMSRSDPMAGPDQSGKQ